MRKAGVCLSAAMLAGSGAAIAAIGGAVDDRATTLQGRPVLIDVRANDAGIGGLRGIKIRSRPANGSASVVGGQVRYVPAPGFTGNDRFSYIVVGTNGTGTASVFVDVGDSLALQGRVVEGPIGETTITASVGGQHFTTSSGAGGKYTLELDPLAEGMVTLDVRGSGEHSHVRLVSVLGDFDRLVQEAGSDGILTREENNQVQVTSVGTAHARLLKAAHGGAQIVSDEQFMLAQERLDHTQLLQQSAAVRLAISGNYPLPAGTTDTLGLISDPMALSEFLASVNRDAPAALSNTMTALTSDAGIIVPVEPAELVGTWSLISALGRPGALDVSRIQGSQLTLSNDGSGRFVNRLPNPAPSLVWSLASGVVNAVPEYPFTTSFFPFVGGVQRHATTTPHAYRAAKLFEGAGRDVLAFSTTSHITYPDDPELEPYFQTTSTTFLGIPDAGGIDALTASDVIGTRSLWVPESYVQTLNGDGGAEYFTFLADNSGHHASGAAFTWQVDALGRIAIALGGDSALIRKLVDDGRAAAGLVVEWRARDVPGVRYMMSAARDGLAFDGVNGGRSWRSGFYLGHSGIEPGSDLTFTLDPGGVAWRRSTTPTSTVVTPVGWRIIDSSIEIIDYRNGTGQPVHACEVGVGGCRITNLRRWNPTAIDGDRIYVIEELFTTVNGTLLLLSHRVNYYDEIVRPQLGQQAQNGSPQRRARAKSLR
jgi:hypothetical protein